MASKRDPYEVATVTGDHVARRMIRRGWELIGQSGGAFLTARVYTLRRPNPKYRGALR